MRVEDGLRSVVRVGGADLAVGAGLLVAPDLVVTCAHVVTDAIGDGEAGPDAPGEDIEVDLPLLAGGPVECRARVQRWWPPQPDGSGDVAVLRLDRAVIAPVPPVRRVDEPWDHTFRAVGFPPDREDGEWAVGQMREHQGAGWVQLAMAPTGPPVGPGFSGTPVWDLDEGCVVALAVAADREPGRAAYALPIEQVLSQCPQVLINPYRGVAAFGVEDAEFFFGRDTDTARCAEVLDRTGLVVVAGGSGTGKSSLLGAGVAAGERARGRPVAAARLNGASTEPDIRRLLADALASVAAGDWAAALTAPAEGSPARPAAVRAGGVLLVVDQLEELAAAAPELAQSAAESLVQLWRSGVRVAATARWATFDVVSGETAEILRGAAVGLQALDRDGLRRAVAEPARRVPGPSFAPGLAERIVDDAADEPGRLPLVQALLAELWDHPDGALLTEEAYETAGRVEGALVASADRTWTDLAPDDQEIARRALVAMTRPVENGFVRAPLDLVGSGAGERRVVEALAARRLVTIGPGPRGDVAELAHQALIEYWPQLGRWLADDADFLRWRDQMRGAAARWEPARDPGSLLRGADLATATAWDRDRRADLEPDERGFIDASRDRAARDRRLRRGAVSGLAVLLVLALVLAVVLVGSNRNLTAALATANARTLAEVAQARLSTDPGDGTQLALAAYATDPDNAEARSALWQAYLTRRSTTAARAIPGAGPVDGLIVAPDTDVAAFPAPAEPPAGATDGRADNGGVVVADGLQGDTPVFATVPGSGPGDRPLAVGGKGRWIVIARPGGAPRVWDRTSPAPAQPLGGPVSTAELTPDTARLLVTAATPTGTTVEVFDLATAGPAEPVVTLPDRAVTRVWATLDPTRLLVESGAPDSRGSHLSVRDARTGAVVRAVPSDAAVAAQGAAVVRCDTPPTGKSGFVIADAASGTTRREIRGGDNRYLACGGNTVTADGHHVVLRIGNSTPTVSRVATYDIDTGRRGLAWIPPAAGLDPFHPNSPLFGRNVPSATTVTTRSLAVYGDRALLADTGAVDTITLDTNQVGPNELGGFLIDSPYADYVLLAYTDGVVTARPGADKVLGDVDLPPDQPLQASFGNDIQAVADGLSAHQLALVITQAGQRTQVRDYALPGLQPLGEFDLAAAGAAGTPGSGEQGSYVQIGRSGDDTAILTGGVLSWWSPDHRLLAPPTTLATDPTTITALVDDLNDGLTTVTPAGQSGGGSDRDGDAVAVREPDGVGIYRPDGPPTRIRANLIPSRLNQQIYLAPDHLVTIEQPGSLVQRDPATGAITAAPLPISPNAYIIGTDSQGRLVTYDDNGATVTLWDLAANKPAGQLALPETSVSLFNLQRTANGEWPINASEQLLRLPLDASTWQARLCATQNRTYTQAELAALPAGIGSGRPCGT